MVIAPVAGAVGLTLVTISHVLPVSLAYEFVPGYVEADEATRASLAVTFDTFANLSLLTNYVGNALGWGVTVPLYAYAILKTRAVPRWIGWLGFVVAVFAGWLGLLAPRVERDRGPHDDRLPRLLPPHAQHGDRHLASPEGHGSDDLRQRMADAQGSRP